MSPFLSPRRVDDPREAERSGESSGYPGEARAKRGDREGQGGGPAQTQAEFSQQALTEAITALAQAELMAGDDESQRQKVEAARKKFEKVKSVHLEHKKRLKDEFTKLNALEPQSGLGGMRGGMGGMGSGMR